MTQSNCKEKMKVFPKKEYPHSQEADVVGFDEEVVLYNKKGQRVIYFVKTSVEQDPNTGEANYKIKSCYRYIREHPSGEKVITSPKINCASLIIRIQEEINKKYLDNLVLI